MGKKNTMTVFSILNAEYISINAVCLVFLSIAGKRKRR